MKKGFVGLIAVGVLATLLSVSGTVLATEKNEKNYELSKKAFEQIQTDKTLKKGSIESHKLNQLETELKSFSKSVRMGKMDTMNDDELIFEIEPNDDFNTADSMPFDRILVGQLLPLFDVDLFKVNVPEKGVFLVGGTTNSYAIDLLFVAFEEDFVDTGAIEYLGNTYEDGVEVQAYQANKAGTYYIGAIDGDNEEYDDNFEEDLYLLTSTFIPDEPSTPKEVDRISGEDRIKTAIEISKDGWDTASTVILAHGYDFPDALAASPLAYQQDAPILLTKQKSLAAETMAELKRLKTEHVIIVGGDNAVSKAIDASLESMGILVERIAGDNRFDTAARIAKRMGGNPDTAIVTDGYNYPDALAISSFAAQNGYPILLTRSDRLPIETNEAVESILYTIVMGGNKAVSPTVFNQLNNPMRIAGNDRYATAVAVVELLGLSTEKVYVATGQGFADALTGSVLAAKNGAPIILVKQNSIPEPTARLIEEYDIRNFTLLGGEGAISESLFQ